MGGTYGAEAERAALREKRKREALPDGRGCHGGRRRLTLAVATGSSRMVAAAVREGQQKRVVLRTAQGLVPLTLEYGGAGEGSDEEGVT